MYHPDYQQSARTKALTSHLDILPTLLENASIEKPSHLHGRSLIPLLQNPNGEHHSEVYSIISQVEKDEVSKIARHKKSKTSTFDYVPSRQEMYSKVMLRNESYKCIKTGYKNHLDNIELYDLINDNKESHNLVDLKEHQHQLRNMPTKIDNFFSPMYQKLVDTDANESLTNPC